MQKAYSKSGVCMVLMSADFLVENLASMSVQMQMPVALMFMLVCMNSKSFPQGPHANGKKDQTDHPFAPG